MFGYTARLKSVNAMSCEIPILAAYMKPLLLIPFEKDDVPTAYWANSEAKATLIFLPGGDGSFGLANKPNAPFQ
jgi:hypothetical protein